MQPSEFQHAVMRTANTNLTDNQRKTNAAMGVAGEAGEFVDLVKKEVFHGHAVDIDKVKKELGDVMFYVAWAAEEYGLQLGDIMQTVINKLKIRYPKGFNTADSIARKDVK